MRQEQLTDVYEYCRRVTQHASKTFYWGSIFLPPPKRRAIWAVYAFCRVVDDTVDEALNVGAPRVGHLSGSDSPVKVLDRWRETLVRLYNNGGTDDDPVLQAWSMMLEDYPVPLSAALELLDGVEMDLAVNRYESFEDLRVYCYRVAGTVGLLSSPIFGYKDASALTYAVDLGIALQLTNILRDIGEDARRNRIYLPLEDMKRFGYTESDLMSGIINDVFRELIHFQIERADEYYRRGQQGIPLLDADCRLAVKLSGTLYRGILDRICLNKYDVFTMRASVPLQTKLRTVSTHWFMQQFEGCVKGPQ